MLANVGRWSLAVAMMLGLMGLAGCGGAERGGEYRTFDPNKDQAPGAEHGHAHEHGPHDGELVELGEEEYHAEFVFDHDNEKISLYLLGADAKTPILIDAKEIGLEVPGQEGPKTYVLAAAPLDGEAEGRSSRFESTEEELVDLFSHDAKVVGKFQVTIDGKTFSGEVRNAHAHAH